MTDIEIAESVEPKRIEEIASKLGLTRDDLMCYGDYKAKIKRIECKPKKDSKLILVTAINPTSTGIGKTTVSIGLADAMRMEGYDACLALREPSLGPVFGIKGGATGGGYSQVIPMADINLHFNGDFHAITSANNLLCSMIDNHIFQGNELDIDPENILFHRCLDVNDRALRQVSVGNTGAEVSRQDSFSITAASEVMAIMCLATSLDDLKRRLGNILVAFNRSGEPVYCRDLKCADAMAILLKDALYPNLVQTLAGTPALIHLGPFANIAHGCNSIIATRLSMSLADYTITEAGFGSDLGAEKFFDIKCRAMKVRPNAVVLVATIPALKLHGGVAKEDIYKENVEAVREGCNNLVRHIAIIKDKFKAPVVVTVNKFASDTQDEIDVVQDAADFLKVKMVVNDAWGKGGEGCIELAHAVKDTCHGFNGAFGPMYIDKMSTEAKIEEVAHEIYGAKNVIFSKEAKAKLKLIKKLRMSKFPIVIAKTQYSLSDDPKLINAPTDFDFTIRDIEIRSGAEFIVAIAGNMMLMPGLSKEPAGTKMTIDNNGVITGLF